MSNKNDLNVIRLQQLIEEIEKETPWYAGLFSSYEVSLIVPGLGSPKIKKGEESKTLKSIVEDIDTNKNRVKNQLGEIKISMEVIKNVAHDLIEEAEVLDTLVGERVGENTDMDAEIALTLNTVGHVIDALEAPTFTAFSSTIRHDFAELVASIESLTEMLHAFTVTPDHHGKLHLNAYFSMPPLGDLQPGDIITLKFPEGFTLSRPVDVVTSFGLELSVLGNTTCSDALTFVVDATSPFGEHDIRLGLNSFDIKPGSTLRKLQYYSSRQFGWQSFPFHVLPENPGIQLSLCDIRLDRPVAPISPVEGPVIRDPISPSPAPFPLP